MRHQTISFVKSGIRILGYIIIGFYSWLWIPAFVLTISEVVGIAEEIGYE